MSEKEEIEHYKTNAYTGVTLDNSFQPTRMLKILPLIKQHYHKLYYTTQSGWNFTWTSFFGEVINGVVIAFLLGYLGFNIFDGKLVIIDDGQTPDYWMVSFAIYGALIYCTNTVLLFRAGQITWFFIAFIFCCSLIPYWVLNFLFDTVISMENSSQRVLINLFQTYHYFLFAAIIVVAVIFIEYSIKVYKMYWKPSLVEYFQFLISNKLYNDPARFEDRILEAFQSNHDPIKRSQHRQLYMTKELESELAQLSQDIDDKGGQVVQHRDSGVDLPVRASSAQDIKRSISNVTDIVKHDANTQENSHRLLMLDHPSHSEGHMINDRREPILSEANDIDDRISISQYHTMNAPQLREDNSVQPIPTNIVSPPTEGHSAIQTQNDLYFNLDNSGSLQSSHGDLLRGMTPNAGNRNNHVHNLSIKVPSPENGHPEQNHSNGLTNGQDLNDRLYKTQQVQMTTLNETKNSERFRFDVRDRQIDRPQVVDTNPSGPSREEPDSPYRHVSTPLPPKRGGFF